MSLLSAHELSFAWSGVPLFAGVSFEVNPGDRIALVGPNGCGKTTLLRLIAGELAPLAGDFVARRGLRIGYLAQTALAGGVPLFDSVFAGEPHLAALRELMRELELRLDDAAAATEYAGLLCRYEEEGGYRFEAEVTRVLEALGFEPAAQADQLSGGERVRAGLARCLLSNADLLLLDEPTNHLDIARREWLERYLIETGRTCIVVSHDRSFLNQVATRTLALERGRLAAYAGNYDFYRRERALAERQEQERYEASQRRLAAAERAAERREQVSARVAATPDGIRGGKDHYARKAAKVARTARLLRERRLHEEEAPKPWREQPIPVLAFRNAPPAPEWMLHSSGLTKAFGAAPLFENLSLHVRRGECWAILGPNGSGKTTLLEILAGVGTPDHGEVHVGVRVKPGYFAQEIEGADLSRSALELCAEAGETMARTLLASLKLPAERVTRPLASLSAGERAKVFLVRLLLSEVNLLLLDEPTNHLEIEAVEALASALGQFPGAVVFASHDRWFIESLAARKLLLGAAAQYSGFEAK
jgi:ATPase subunit of ABC transporter with duplicated ATPase domains